MKSLEAVELRRIVAAVATRYFDGKATWEFAAVEEIETVAREPTDVAAAATGLATAFAAAVTALVAADYYWKHFPPYQTMPPTLVVARQAQSMRIPVAVDSDAVDVGTVGDAP